MQVRRLRSLPRSILNSLLFFLLIIAMSRPAQAALGDSIASHGSERAHRPGRVEVRQYAGYDVHEISADSGVQVRLYVAPNGMIFAVSWQGPALPDLKQELGVYFPRYQEVQRRIRRGPLVLREPGLVVEMSGHMRSFLGRAYVPEMMPQGARGDDVQ